MNSSSTHSRNTGHVAVAQLGARRHYAVPEALQAAGVLDTLLTDLYATSPWLRLGAKLLRSTSESARLLGRESAGIPHATVRQFPVFGLRRAWQSRKTRSKTDRLRQYLEANRTFCRLVCENWPASADTLYVFNSAGLEILEEAKRRGCVCVVDQITAPWAIEEPLLEEERQRWPGWEEGATDRAAWDPLAEREQTEWALADVIICGSEFVRDGVARLGGPVEKCVVVPYGVRDASLRTSPRDRHDGPLRVLFAGTLQLRKGVQYLLEAARLVPAGSAVFRLAGASQFNASALEGFAGQADVLGAVPRSDMGAQYEWADVLVAPSISEGSANVCYEALAAGLPVIATANTGSIVRDGADGYIVPIRDAQTIADRITAVAASKELWSKLSAGAATRAAEHTWSKYAERLVMAISKARGT